MVRRVACPTCATLLLPGKRTLIFHFLRRLWALGGLIPLQWRRSTHPCRVPGEFQRELLWLILNFRTMLNRHFLVGILFFVVVILIFCISLKCFVCMMVCTIHSVMLPCTVRSLAFFPLKNACTSFVKVLVEIRLNVVAQVLSAHPSVVYYGTVLCIL